MTSQTLVTAIVHTYNRPAMLREAVEALQRQTHSNLEIILINNGATAETVEYLREAAASDQRIKILDFEENQFSWDEPSRYITVTWNAALKEATGDYVWIQEDDDFLADDYTHKMVALFEENPECTTAAGLPVSVRIDGQPNPDQIQDSNQRPRYTAGKDLALNYVTGDRSMFSAPGTIFTIKREVLVETGGYHRCVEDGHVLGCVPFGFTGFDPTAIFYWRHHEGQVNKQLSDRGKIGIEESLGLVRALELEKRWSVFGADEARDLVRSYRKRVYDGGAKWFVTNFYAFRPRPAFRIMRDLGLRPYFWARVFAHALERKYFAQAVAPLIKPPLKRLYRICPGLAKLTPGLSAKADRWA